MNSFFDTHPARAARRAVAPFIAVTFAALGAACGDNLPAALIGPRVPPARLVRPATNPVVNSLSDAGNGICDQTECTLREAINLAALAGQNLSVITFAQNLAGTINTTGELQIGNAQLVISGPGSAGVTVHSTNGRVLHVTGSANVLISNLTLIGGPNVGEGGAIYNSGNLTLEQVTITGSQAFNGGAIMNRGTLRLTNSTVAGNVARRPGVGGVGGGIANRGTLYLVSSTVSGNVADDAGDGAYGSGGGLDIATSSPSLTFIANSIVAGNTAVTAPDIATSPTSQLSTSVALIGDGTGSGQVDGAGGSRVGTSSARIDPRLGPLASNGGPTQTMALLAGSPAIDLVPSTGANCVINDQRDVMRPHGAGCDAGAFEVVVGAPPVNQAPVAARGTHTRRTRMLSATRGPSAMARAAWVLNERLSPEQQRLSVRGISEKSLGYYRSGTRSRERTPGGTGADNCHHTVIGLSPSHRTNPNSPQ